MGLAAGDDQRVAALRQALHEAGLVDRGEMELGQRRVAQRAQRCDVRAEASRILLGADDVDAQLARRGRELRCSAG